MDSKIKIKRNVADVLRKGLKSAKILDLLHPLDPVFDKTLLVHGARYSIADSSVYKMFQISSDDFQLTFLSTREKLELLQCDYELFSGVARFDDFNELPHKTKRDLLISDFKMFGDKINIASLPTEMLIDLFITAPVRYSPYIDFSKVPMSLFWRVADRSPTLFKKHSLPLKKIGDRAWAKLLKHDRSYFVSPFMENIASIRNKSDLRWMFQMNPSLIPELTVDAAMNSVVTGKEWVLLLSRSRIKGRMYSEEVRQWLDQQLSIEVLKGSKNSKRLQNARKLINE